MPDRPTAAAIPFERIVCINLDRRPDRWEGFLASATPHIPEERIERFSGFDARASLVPTWWNGTPGGYGATMSHRLAIGSVFGSGAESALIFEDDAMLAPDFGPRLAEFMARVPDDWQMLYLGGQHRPRFKPLPVAEGVVRCRHTIRMHGFAVHRRGAQAVFDKLSRTSKICDQAVADIHPRVVTYAPTRWMVAQRADFSDVESRRHEKDRWWE